MNQDLAVAFPLPVVLALVAMMLLLVVLLRALLAWERPMTVRAPAAAPAAIGAELA